MTNTDKRTAKALAGVTIVIALALMFTPLGYILGVTGNSVAEESAAQGYDKTQDVINTCVGIIDDDLKEAGEEGGYDITVEVSEYKVVGDKYIVNLSSTMVSDKGYVSSKPKFLTILCDYNVRDDMVFAKAQSYVDL